MMNIAKFPFISIVLTAFIGVVGATLFQLLHIPMPWLLGPLFAVLITKFTTPLPLKWPRPLRDLGLVIAGYSIGLAFTVQAVGDIIGYLPLMIILNILYIGLFLGVSFFIARRTNVDRLSSLTSVVPGGMSQIIIYAVEKDSQEITMITFYHVLRVLCILSFVPLLVASHHSVPTSVQHAHYSMNFIVMIAICFGAGYVASKIHIPTAYMLGPVFLLMGLQLLPIELPSIPLSALHIAQILLGIYIGLLLKKEDLHLSKRVIFYAFVSVFIYIASAYGLALIVMQFYPFDFKTTFLSIVPGGLDQMGLIAASVHADVTIVTAFQLFRVLVVTLIIIPMMKVIAK